MARIQEYTSHYRYKNGSASITHSGFSSQDAADFSVAISLAEDKYFILPKLRTRWFQFWRKEQYNYMESLVSEIRKEK